MILCCWCLMYKHFTFIIAKIVNASFFFFHWIPWFSQMQPRLHALSACVGLTPTQANQALLNCWTWEKQSCSSTRAREQCKSGSWTLPVASTLSGTLSASVALQCSWDHSTEVVVGRVISLDWAKSYKYPDTSVIQVAHGSSTLLILRTWVAPQSGRLE